MVYRYFEVRLGRERTAQKAFADHIRRSLSEQVVALFSPLLGFASNEALVLTTGAVDAGAVLNAPGVAGGHSDALSPTLRPTDGATPMAGGIYVHNWFTIDGNSFDEFVRLSGVAWPDFERRFDARIFGLFAAAASQEERATGARRLLLMTRYKDLGEWQASRDPTTEAMQVFARRRELTRVSLARACVLAP
jgi:hypothetical protein